MSEEILRALMELFAIIAKQDGGAQDTEAEYVHSFLIQQLNEETAMEYYTQFTELAGYDKNKTDREIQELISVRDSVKTLGICRKINKSLNQKQKVVVLVRLFELINADRRFTEKRMEIINTVADVFKITSEEFKSVEAFVIHNDSSELDTKGILVINHDDVVFVHGKKIKSEAIDGNVVILQVKSTELYFLRYTGNQNTFLNGLTLDNKRIYLFAPGSTIKLPKGKPVYYTDIVARKFLSNVLI